MLQIGLMTTLITTVVTMSSIAQLWDDEWEMVFISLQVSCVRDASLGGDKSDHSVSIFPSPGLFPLKSNQGLAAGLEVEILKLGAT